MKPSGRAVEAGSRGRSISRPGVCEIPITGPDGVATGALGAGWLGPAPGTQPARTSSAATPTARRDEMREAGVEVLSRLFPGTVHGFLRAQGRVGAADEAVAEAGRWLRERLG